MNLERAQLAIVAALAAAAFVSIFATQLLLGVGILVLFARILGGRVRFPRTPLDGPTLAFCLWTLLSASFSTNPGHSHDSAKKLVLFLLFYLAVDTLASPNARHRVLTAALLGGLALSSLTLLQYFLLGFDTLNVRPRGFLGHYMSASGLTMGVVILSAARLAFARAPLRVNPQDRWLLAGLLGALVLVGAAQTAERPAAAVTGLFVLGLAITGGALALAEPRWTDASTGTLLAALALPLGSLALLVSQTRNAWLGAVAGLATVAVLRAPRTLWLLAAAMLAVLAVRPAAVMNRLTLEDASSRDRYYMWQAGIDMILDKPVFGQGPGMILAMYPSYRWSEAPNPRAPHLHDNALQIAAERGLPCLVFWLWWMAAAMADAWREARRGAPAAVAALAALVAIMVAGLFEYNFGDSEVLMFVLLVASLPYALRRERTLASGAPA
ncbi:MAG: O-antigen ligase family protein [Solirubrobacterales bacterium]